jgi:hypothetical protein
LEAAVEHDVAGTAHGEIESAGDWVTRGQFQGVSISPNAHAGPTDIDGTAPGIVARNAAQGSLVAHPGVAQTKGLVVDGDATLQLDGRLSRHRHTRRAGAKCGVALHIDNDASLDGRSTGEGIVSGK